MQIAVLVLPDVQIREAAGEEDGVSVQQPAAQIRIALGLALPDHSQPSALPGRELFHSVQHEFALFVQITRVERRLVGVHRTLTRTIRLGQADVVHADGGVRVGDKIDSDVIHGREIGAPAHFLGVGQGQIQLVPAVLCDVVEQIPRGLVGIRHAGAAQLHLTGHQVPDILYIEPHVQIPVLILADVHRREILAQHIRVPIAGGAGQVGIPSRGAVPQQLPRGAIPAGEALHLVDHVFPVRIHPGGRRRAVVGQLQAVDPEDTVAVRDNIHPHEVAGGQIHVASDFVRGAKRQVHLVPARLLGVLQDVPAQLPVVAVARAGQLHLSVQHTGDVLHIDPHMEIPVAVGGQVQSGDKRAEQQRGTSLILLFCRQPGAADRGTLHVQSHPGAHPVPDALHLIHYPVLRDDTPRRFRFRRRRSGGGRGGRRSGGGTRPIHGLHRGIAGQHADQDHHDNGHHHDGRCNEYGKISAVFQLFYHIPLILYLI